LLLFVHKKKYFSPSNYSAPALILTTLKRSVSMAVESRLKSYRVAPNQHSVSGLSSGAFMAVQLHLAHSASFVGAGIIAGGPYRCVETVQVAGLAREDSNIMNAEYVCMTPLTPRTAPNARRLADLAQATPNIDDLENIRDQRLYIFTGTADVVVSSIVVQRTREFYENLGVSAGNILFIDDVPAGHSIITNNPEDSPLAMNRPPYINNGGFMQSHDILEHIYGDLNPPSLTLPGALLRFEQAEFAGERFDASSLDKYGYVYIPEAVGKGGQARGVHIALHGCKQGVSYVNFSAGVADSANAPPFGNRYFTTTGYNQIAESNDFIVLYPQVTGNDGGIVQNPDGCWDWWGYSSANSKAPDYYSKDAVQISAIYKMLERLCKLEGTKS
jgi:predicted esterase